MAHVLPVFLKCMVQVLPVVLTCMTQVLAVVLRFMAYVLIEVLLDSGGGVGRVVNVVDFKSRGLNSVWVQILQVSRFPSTSPTSGVSRIFQAA